jgi:hypothetical protein
MPLSPSASFRCANRYSIEIKDDRIYNEFVKLKPF